MDLPRHPSGSALGLPRSKRRVAGFAPPAMAAGFTPAARPSVNCLTDGRRPTLRTRFLRRNEAGPRKQFRGPAWCADRVACLFLVLLRLRGRLVILFLLRGRCWLWLGWRL